MPRLRLVPNTEVGTPARRNEPASSSSAALRNIPEDAPDLNDNAAFPNLEASRAKEVKKKPAAAQKLPLKLPPVPQPQRATPDQEEIDKEIAAKKIPAKPASSSVAKASGTSDVGGAASAPSFTSPPLTNIERAVVISRPKTPPKRRPATPPPAPLPAEALTAKIPPVPWGTTLPPHLRRNICLLYTSPSPRDRTRSRMPSSA